jgi:hypothetical protein
VCIGFLERPADQEEIVGVDHHESAARVLEGLGKQPRVVRGLQYDLTGFFERLGKLGKVLD